MGFSYGMELKAIRASHKYQFSGFYLQDRATLHRHQTKVTLFGTGGKSPFVESPSMECGGRVRAGGALPSVGLAVLWSETDVST